MLKDKTVAEALMYNCSVISDLEPEKISKEIVSFSIEGAEHNQC